MYIIIASEWVLCCLTLGWCQLWAIPFRYFLLMFSFLFKGKQAFVLGLLVFLFCKSLCAQTDSLVLQILDPVVITATKYPLKQSQTGKVLSIIGKEILEKSGGQSLAELLNRQVGIQIIGANNAPGTNQDIYLRGANPGYTLILLDGVPVYDPSNINNGFDLNLLQLDQIERIEILKGGQSTLYGSDALAGVINIIRKRSASKALELSSLLSAGSYGTMRGNLSLSGQNDKTYFSAQASGLSSQGFSTAYDQKGNGKFDQDGFGQYNFNGRVEQILLPHLRILGQANYERYQADIDAGAFKDDTDYTFSSKNLTLNSGLLYQRERLRITLQYSRNRNERLFHDDSTNVPLGAFAKFQESLYRGSSDFAELYGNVTLGSKAQLLLGVENRRQNTEQRYLSVSDFGPYRDGLNPSDTRTNLFSNYASLNLQNLGILGLEIGGRGNWHNIFGHQFTYTFNPYLLFGKDRYKVFGNLSSSFKAPTQYQLFSPYGNPDLRAENGVNLELGVQWFSSDRKSNWRALFFAREIKDVIVFSSLSQAPFGIYQNFNTQKDQGIELDGQWQSGKFSFSGNYTYLIGQVNTTLANGRDTTYNNLIRRPKNALNLQVGYQIGKKWSVNLHLRSIGERRDLVFDEASFRSKEVMLDPYTTIDLYQQWQFNPRQTLFLDLKNLGNVHYFDLAGFNTRRFNFVLGWRWQLR
jgi:vitamin B12 transporter